MDSFQATLFVVLRRRGAIFEGPCNDQAAFGAVVFPRRRVLGEPPSESALATERVCRPLSSNR
jgi:hypothetical protein